MAPPNTKVKIVLGAMTFGKPNTLGARVHTAEGAGSIVDAFTQHGHNEVDTARMYGNGTTEELLAELDWKSRGLIMATKLYPNARVAPKPSEASAQSPDDEKGGPNLIDKLKALQTSQKPTEAYTHKPVDVRRGLMNSLKALQTDKISMFYLHGPDRLHPIEDTLREINALHREGYFTRFGISNYMSWEVARMCELCEREGWVKPSVYQGIYHALQRRVDDELLPCLRQYGIALYAFQPLAGGFLTGRYARDQEAFEDGSRFDPKIIQGALHRTRYWNDMYFDGLDVIKAAADKHGLTVAEVALRWLVHHSTLEAEHGDAVIVGASSVRHLEENLDDVEKGPLPRDVVVSLDEAWLKAKAVAPKYWL